MDGQRAHLVSSLDRVPTIEARRALARPARRPSPPDALAPHGQITTAWAAVVGLGWPLVMAASMALEPAPADPDASAPLVVELAALGLLAGLMTTVVAAGMRHRAAPLAGAAAGVVFLTFAVLCPVTGHHAIGMWWFTEIGLVAGMLGVSVAALGRRARSAG